MKKKTTKPRSIKKVLGKPLAAVSVNGGICLLERLDKRSESRFFLSWSTDGLDFSTDERPVVIKISAKKEENPKICENFSISGTPTGFVMTYVRKSKKKGEDVIVIARSSDLYVWHVKSEIARGDSFRATIVYDKPLDYFVLYQDGMFVKNQMTRTLVSWRQKSSLIFTSRYGMFDSGAFTIIGSIPTKDGLLVLYDASVRDGKKTLLQIGGVLFDLNQPKRIIWRSEAPLWQGVVEAKEAEEEYAPIGFVYFNNTFMVYWRTNENEMILSTFPALFKTTDIYQYNILERFHANPVIEPRAHHEWEVVGTFNPAVFQDEDGVHLFYRAIGKDGISRIGYARSKDGLKFDKRLPYPVFEPSRGAGMPDPQKVMGPKEYNPAYYTSGGGWGGSEDPRVVKIGNRIYMTYVAFEGWGSIRIAISSISVDDFKNERWRWREPLIISPPGEQHKNWVLFPEKINGKFAILHGIAPKILIDYIDDVVTFKGYVQSPRPGGPQPGRIDSWDYKLRGAGPPPLKTPIGWLVFYHAHDANEPHRYKLGAMVLDLNDPTKILHRSPHAVLSPDMWYENEGKPGIVYVSGAVIRGDDLYIYYGGGDRVVCIASTPLKQFLDYLVSGKPDAYELKKVSTRVS